jgi:putative membrane protein
MSIRSLSLLLGCAAACAAVLLVPGTSAAGDTVTRKAAGNFDAHWLRAGVQADVFAIASAKLAASSAINPSVRATAEAIIATHLRAIGKRRALARTLKVPLSKRANPVQTLSINELASVAADPAIFEPMFARVQAASHRLAILETAEAARAAGDPAVRRLARSLLTMLKRNLVAVDALGS